MLLKEDLGIIQMRLKETIKILSNFKTLRDQNKTRADYVEELKSDICASFDYNREVVDIIFDLFAPAEALEFIEANEN
jgi:25S rRNA (cytosine2870-C5)-methyltransferase